MKKSKAGILVHFIYSLFLYQETFSFFLYIGPTAPVAGSVSLDLGSAIESLLSEIGKYFGSITSVPTKALNKPVPSKNVQYLVQC